MIVAHRHIAASALGRLITACLCRERGVFDPTCEELRHEVVETRRKLSRGEVEIVFDEETGACRIAPKLCMNRSIP
jgi:uncharacterized protein YheU (UPF0270 family)